MLRELQIRNFALIDELSLCFEAGLNVITGETGAGKTILMAALELAVGGKASAEVIRTGEEEATIEAVFSLPGDGVRRRLERAGVEGLRDELLVRRALARSGRNRVHLNGALATLGVLESIADALIRVYGQHDHHALRQADTHLGLLDAFAGHAELLTRMSQRFESYRALAERLRRLVTGKETARARAEMLRFQIRDIADARLSPGEEDELRRERQVIASAEKLAEAARFGEEALYAGEGAAAATLRKLSVRLVDLVATDSRLGDVAKLVDEAHTLVEEAGWRLREYAEKVVFDPERLAEVDDRLVEIGKLKRKYGDSVEAVLGFHEAAVRELADLDLGEEGLAALERETEAAEQAAREAAGALSKSRRAAARRLESQIAAELAALGMKEARFEVRFAAEPAALSARGDDAVELFFSANPGEEPRALARVASGGELSRIMLALKSLALEDADAATVIFDEVDAGIGGAVAEAVGRKLAALARRRQVLCITHLPQIAAFADHHFAVEKTTVKGRTRSTARRLSAEQRREEIARMLGGVKVSAEARSHAEQLLAAAQRRRTG
ncbi:MAG: DNA repair protein RecN [Deltaproteobacteria bacterium]|nr:DNA repair protein RecN [Deltaproteobacteria bacterium]